jgi:glyoxylase I family protein
MSATTDEAGKRTPLTSAADFHLESVLRSRARPIFAQKQYPAHERGENARIFFSLPQETMLQLNKVHHIAIICSDYRRSLEFYTCVLGLRVLAEHYRAERQSYKTDLALGEDYVVELFSFPSPPPRPTRPEATGLRHLAFEVDDIDAAVNELDRLSIPHEAIRTDEYTDRRFLFLQDPDGLPIELYEK